MCILHDQPSSSRQAAFSTQQDRITFPGATLLLTAKPDRFLQEQASKPGGLQMFHKLECPHLAQAVDEEVQNSGLPPAPADTHVFGDMALANCSNKLIGMGNTIVELRSPAMFCRAPRYRS